MAKVTVDTIRNIKGESLERAPKNILLHLL